MDSLREELQALRRQVAALTQAESHWKQTVESLRAGEERFRSLIENATDVILVLAGDGSIQYAGPSLERALGYRPEEVLGDSVFDVVSPEERTPLTDALQTALHHPGAGLSPLGFHVRHKEGAWRLLEVHVKNLLPDPAVRGIVVNCRDITERRELEEQVLQLQKMDSIGQLAGGVAHDFNNLLTAILGYAELLELELPAAGDLTGYVGNIRKAAERAAGLTSQLLAFARRQIIEPKAIDLNALILNMESMLRRLIGENIELITIPAASLGAVKIDPGQMEQILVNLAVNARDAMPGGGKLLVETDNVTLAPDYARRHAAVMPGSYVMLAVSDTGGGMSTEVKGRIFEPFFTTKGLGRGTGLGLATCYGIVGQNGGYIWVYSEPGHGTTFKIYLPRIDEAAEPLSDRERRDDLPRGTETILLVEDEPAVRDIAVHTLREQGYTVIMAENGVDALGTAAEHSGIIHLVVTDIIMPRMGGRQLTEYLVVERPGIKILYTSGYTDNAIVHHGLLQSGVAFLQKPFTPAALARKIRAVLDG